MRNISQYTRYSVPTTTVPQLNPAVPHAMAQVAVDNPEEQLFIQSESTQMEVDRFANMYRTLGLWEKNEKT